MEIKRFFLLENYFIIIFEIIINYCNIIDYDESIILFKKNLIKIAKIIIY